MGKSNVPLLSERTLATFAEQAGTAMVSGTSVNVAGWDVSTRDVGVLILAFVAAIVGAVTLYLFLRTNLGTAMQAAGRQPADDPRAPRSAPASATRPFDNASPSTIMFSTFTSSAAP